MKKYETIRHVMNSDSFIFQGDMASAINEIQEKGLSVEVQYQTSPLRDTLYLIRYSALILGYKEV